jgi:hypothetical protein
MGFDPRLGWGRIAAAGRLYVVRTAAFVAEVPPAGARVEFAPLARLRGAEAWRVRALVPPAGAESADSGMRR